MFNSQVNLIVVNLKETEVIICSSHLEHENLTKL